MATSRFRMLERLAFGAAAVAFLAVIYTGVQAARANTYLSRLNGPDGFHYFYYHQDVWQRTTWLGVPIKKLPLDLFAYQELLYELKPDIVIEAGTLYGGSALFFASMMDLIGKGQVITIDIEKFPNLPQHPRITYLLGSSTSDEILKQVKALIPAAAKVMVVLDSDHSRNHVLNELRLYHPLVSPGHYLIVEDTNVNGHPVYPDHGPGPMEALDGFMRENSDFEIDRSREKFLLSFNPRGYLKKKLGTSEGHVATFRRPEE